MAVLETIRVKFGILITVLIAVALLSFIIDPSSLSLFSSNPEAQETEVASINGKGITYTEFNNQYRMYTDAYPYEYYEATVRQQNPDLSTEEIKKLYHNELRSRVLNNFLMANHYVPKAKAAGFNVSDEEMYQLLSGQMFSNTIYSEFGGQMTPELLVEVEANSNQALWENLKKSVEDERYLTKYSETFAKSLFSNSILVEENIKNSNNVFDVEFVMVPFGTDSTVVVSDEEIEEYYNAHKNLFPCNETRDLEYVVVDFDVYDEDAAYAQVDSVFTGVKDVETFRKAAVDNGYFIDNINVPMYATSFGSIAKVESIVKWAYKESAAGSVSEIFTVENDGKNYFIIAALNKINPEGYSPLEQVRPIIENTLYVEKAADKKLAEVSSKVNGLSDLNAIADALGTTVSTKEKLTFASSDFDPKFTGAASVAQEGVVNAPFKGSNGIYVYKVTNRSEEAYYTEDDAKMRMAQLSASYAQMLPFVLNKEGQVKDYSYLYF